MSLMEDGKELKFKSADGKIIKVSLEGSSYNETDPGSDKCTPPQSSQE
jgi:hypothetical protein